MLLLAVAERIFAEFASTFQLVLKGMMVGIVASAPMGPVGILCIRRTLQKGRAYGIATGAGAALSDFFYALVTGFGMALVMPLIENERNLFMLKLLGSTMLLIFGIYMFRSEPRTPHPSTADTKGKGSLLHNMVTSFFVTLSNPLIIFLFLALFNMFTFVVPVNFFGMCVGYLSIVGGAMLWWLGLTYVINKMRTGFGQRGIRRLNHTIGCIVLVVSVVYAITTVFHLSLY